MKLQILFICNPKHLQVSKRPSRSSANSKRDDTDAVSFRFRRGSKDMFEELVDNKDNKEAINKDRKRKNEEESGKSSRSRSSGLHFNTLRNQL